MTLKRYITEQKIDEVRKVNEDDIMMDIQDILSDMVTGETNGLTLEDYFQALVATAADYNIEKFDTMKDDMDDEDYTDGVDFFKKALKAIVKVKI